MKTTRYIIALILLVFAAQAFAQTDITLKPKAGPAPKVAFPSYYETVLPNGLKVFVVTNDKEPVVTFRIMIKSGAEYDGDKPGVGEFTTDLLTKGTKTRTSLQFATEADALGINVGGGAGTDQMSLSGSGLKKHMSKILDLMTDALFNPIFPKDELDKSQKQTLSGLAMAKKDPGTISGRLENTIGFNVNPYSAFETEESVKSITRDDLEKFHKTYFIPNNASLAIVGDVTPKEVMGIVKKYFGDWKKGALPNNSFPDPKPITGKNVNLVDLGSTQSQSSVGVIVTGMKRNNPDYLAMQLANAVLGGGSHARLFMNLREKHSFTYGVYSGQDARKMGGIWSASGDVRRDATDSAVTEILKEMERLRTELIPAEELDMNKQFFSGHFMMALENPANTATRVQDIDLYNLPKDYYKTLLSRLMKLTAQDIQDVAKKYYTPENIAINVVGDAGVVKEPLAKFGAVHMYDANMKPVTDAPAMKIDIDAVTLLEKHFKASGGRDKMAAIKDRTTEGAITMQFGQQSMEGTMIQIRKAPNKSYEKMEFQMGAQESWCDGVNAVRAGGPQLQKLSGKELDETLEEAQFNDLLRYKELGYTPTVKAKKIVDGKTVYVLEVKRKFSNQTLLVDAESFLLFGEEKEENSPSGPVMTSVRFSDYKPVDGVMMPFKIKIDAGQMTMQMDVVSHKQNTNVADDVFVKK